MKKRAKAISLIESIVYIAVFGIVFLFIMQYLFSISEANQNANTKKEFEKSAIFLNQHLNDTFSKAVSVDTANSIFNTDNGKVRINLTSGFKEYSILNNQINFNNNGTNSYLTPPEIKITKLYFDQVLNSSNTLVGIRVTVNMVSPKNSNISNSYITSYIIK